MHTLRSTFAHIGLLMILVIGLFLTAYHTEPVGELPPTAPTATTTPVLATSSPAVTSSQATSSPIKQTATSTATSTPKAKKASITATKSTPTAPTTSPNEISRIENPYPTPPLAFESVNVSARAALVNIFCATKSSGVLSPITGSGIMIDPRGIVLTNAHVAQYVLIAESGKTDLECSVRTGAPAVAKWVPVALYVPSAWINIHAADIIKSHALGTGEHDFALLYMAATVDGSPRPPSFAYVAPDTREAVAFVDDTVLAASYPVEFVGGSVIQSDLFPVTSITTVRQLFTLSTAKADVLSLGGIIGAQSGSSGGGVVNQWGRLVGIITTTSDGATTGARDLHAITTAYINRDLIALTGSSLSETLASDPRSGAEAFLPAAAALADKLISVISGR